jgi:uncharacterized cupin superfamily protein
MSRVVNLLQLELPEPREPLPPGRDFRWRSLTREVGAKRTGLGIYEVAPGQAHWPYHFELAEEEWLIVLAGEVTLRTPDGERVLRVGDVACFPAGADGAHAVRNAGTEPARFAMPSSSLGFADGCIYPDAGSFVLRGPGFEHRGRLGEELGYWEAQEPS